LIPGCFSTWDAGKEKNRSRWPVFLCPGLGDRVEINDLYAANQNTLFCSSWRSLRPTAKQS